MTSGPATIPTRASPDRSEHGTLPLAVMTALAGVAYGLRRLSRRHIGHASRGLAPCPQTTHERLAFTDPACLETGTDGRGYPVHTVCLYDTWFPLWTGGEVLCVTTEHWAYLPAPGACANGSHCVLTVSGARVLCE